MLDLWCLIKDIKEKNIGDDQCNRKDWVLDINTVFSAVYALEIKDGSIHGTTASKQLNSVSSQCARGKSSLMWKSEIHPNFFLMAKYFLKM